MRGSLPGGGAAVRGPRYRRGGGGTSYDHGARCAPRPCSRSRPLALSLARGRSGRRQRHGGPGWTTWGNSPVRQSRASASALTTENAKRLQAGLVAAASVASAPRSRSTSRKIASGGKRRDIYVTASESGRVTAFDARTGKAALDARARLVSTGCLQMPKGIFGVTGTPVYDPAGGYVYVAATDKLWALDVHSRRAAQRLARRRCRSTSTTSTCGARSRSATGTSTSASPRTATAGPTAGACSRSRPASGAVDHSWTTVDDSRRCAGRRRHLGLGRGRHHGRRPCLGRQRERQHLDRRRRGAAITPSRSSSSAPRSPCSRRATRPACRTTGDFGFGSTPIVFKADGLRLARRSRGQGRRALPVAARQARRRAGAAARAGLPRDALRLARLGSQDPAALPHDLAGLRRPAGRARRARGDQEVPAAARLDEGPRRPAQRRADRRQQHGASSSRAPGTCASTPRPRAGSSPSASWAARPSPRRSRSAAMSPS